VSKFQDLFMFGALVSHDEMVTKRDGIVKDYDVGSSETDKCNFWCQGDIDICY
jgi:hypothetical protein